MLKKFFLTLIACMPLTLIASENKANAEIDTSSLNIQGMVQPSPTQIVTVQPIPAQFDELAKLGVKHVINLRTPTEQKWNEQEYVEALGMSYINIPVAGMAGINAENAALLSAELEKIGDELVLIHCASGNRVGALMAVDDYVKNKDSSQAIAIGQSWGLTSLAPKVKQKLENNQI